MNTAKKLREFELMTGWLIIFALITAAILVIDKRISLHMDSLTILCFVIPAFVKFYGAKALKELNTKKLNSICFIEVAISSLLFFLVFIGIYLSIKHQRISSEDVSILLLGLIIAIIKLAKSTIYANLSKGCK